MKVFEEFCLLPPRYDYSPVFCLLTVTAIIVDYNMQYNAPERWKIGIKTTGTYGHEYVERSRSP